MTMNSKLITSLAMLIIFLIFVIQAFSFGPQARAMPLLIGVPGIIFCIFQIVIDVRRENGSATAGRYFSPGELPIMAWIVASIMMVIAFGFSFGAPPMVAVYLLLIAEERPRTAMIGAVVCFLMFYVLFERLMGAQLFHGLFTSYHF